MVGMSGTYLSLHGRVKCWKTFDTQNGVSMCRTNNLQNYSQNWCCHSHCPIPQARAVSTDSFFSIIFYVTYLKRTKMKSNAT